ncbi:hypothetical protein [Corynebacterium halotolerans]|uniref:Uncharacterized protein n=1 Tax=Corynebacterium halotolerans YIM 70093 = DSM 44683 TaxID=1121362 RepID=M1NW17_9CORY|nr:hypothetical protein [Corynebacterium halotolerans]AGF73672.1 hypothetical protein A605_13380 [Corynebacterium halotolerans YIM 70093 = DSM 44683]
MNRTTHEVALFRQLALNPNNVIMLVIGVVMALMATTADSGWQHWFFTLLVVSYLLICRPNFSDYRALNLSRSQWVRHKRLMVVLYAAVLLATVTLVEILTPEALAWPVTSGVVAATGWQLLCRPRPSDSWAGNVTARDTDEEAAILKWLPPTPVNQILRGMQLRIWAATWFSFLVVVLLISLVTGYFGELMWMQGTTVIIVMGLFVSGPLMKVIGTSLDEWVAFGGTRHTWARETALLGLTGPVVVAIFSPIFVLLPGLDQAAEAITILFSVALLLPILVILLELSDRNRIWWVSLPFTAVAFVAVALRIRENIGNPGFLLLLVLLYLAFALALPSITRRHVVFTAGLRGWLGLTLGERNR